MGTGNYSVSNNKTNTSLTKRKMAKVQNNVKNNQIECFNYIGILNFGLLSILLVIYIVIIFYQNNYHKYYYSFSLLLNYYYLLLLYDYNS